MNNDDDCKGSLCCLVLDWALLSNQQHCNTPAASGLDPEKHLANEHNKIMQNSFPKLMAFVIKPLLSRNSQFLPQQNINL